MKHQKLLRNFTNTAGLTGALLLIAMPLSVHAAAGANTVYISPASASVQNGNNITVDVRFNPSTAANGGADGVDGIDTTINFNSSQLQYVNVDPTGSAFASGLLTSAGSGSIHVARAQNIGDPYVTTDSLAFHVTFKALTGGVSSGLTVAGSTQMTHGQTFTSPGVQGATLTLTTPASAPATCPSGQTGTPPNCVTPPASGSGGSTTTKPTGGSSNTGNSGSSTTPATGTGSSSGSSKPTTGSPGATTSPTNAGQVTIGSKTIDFTNAAFTITTAKPSQVYIQYGLAKSALSSSTDPDALGTSHSVALDPKLLIPGETYYYTVVTKDASGNVVQGQVESFTTKGLTVSIGIFDKSHQPLKHAQVTLHSNASTATTDDKGYALFSNVIPGDHHVSFTQDGKDYSQPVVVANTVVTKDGVQTAPAQSLSVVYSLTSAKKTSALPFVVGAILVLAVAATVYLVLRKKSRTAPKAAMAAGIAAAGMVTAPLSAGQPPVTSSPVQAPASVVMSSPSVGPAIDTVQAQIGPQPGSMITPKDDAASDNEPRLSS